MAVTHEPDLLIETDMIMTGDENARVWTGPVASQINGLLQVRIPIRLRRPSTPRLFAPDRIVFLVIWHDDVLPEVIRDGDDCYILRTAAHPDRCVPVYELGRVREAPGYRIA